MGPLKGIRALDLSRFQACPLSSMVLADMGAEVIRIEDPKGAPDRTWGDLAPDGETLLFKVIARNKKGITLKIDTPQGWGIFEELVRKSDIVLHNFTPGAPIGPQLTYENLRSINNSLIVVSLSGYGQSGPAAKNPCFDGVAQARSGSMVINGFRGSPPIKAGLPYIDINAGLFAAVGILIALYNREKTGQGQAIDVSLFDTAFFAVQSVGVLLVSEIYKEIRTQIGNRGFHSYNTCFKAKDRWIQIASATNGIWRRFAKAIGREDLTDDPRFKNDMDRFRNGEVLDSIVNEWAKDKMSKDIIQLFEKARVPCSTVNDVAEAAKDPQVKAREMIKLVNYPGVGEIPVPGIPVKLSLTPGEIKSPSPKIGEHNEEIYGGLLGFSPAQISELKQNGVI